MKLPKKIFLTLILPAAFFSSNAVNAGVDPSRCDIQKTAKVIYTISKGKVPKLGYDNPNHNSIVLAAIACYSSGGDMEYLEPVGKYSHDRYGAGLFGITPATATRLLNKNVSKSDLQNAKMLWQITSVILAEKMNNTVDTLDFLSKWYCGVSTSSKKPCPIAHQTYGFVQAVLALTKLD
jgi:hypothetical protein